MLTPGGTIYSGPIPGNPTLGTLTPNTPVVASAKDSIFNSQGFNIDVANFEIWIRERAGLTDKNQRRAAVYAALMVIAKNQNRTLYGSLPKEQVLMDWLALQVLEAARLALEEYDRWNRDPWVTSHQQTTTFLHTLQQLAPFAHKHLKDAAIELPIERQESLLVRPLNPFQQGLYEQLDDR